MFLPLWERSGTFYLTLGSFCVITIISQFNQIVAKSVYKPVGNGTGLGLSICHDIIKKKHGGSLLCNSKIGEGTEFVIRIPQ
ncbi:MAG: HAMP domain-containing histidine kinase [Hormoscilla sp. GUM202]|nr:HAMP domain-containing histidine kinase [Hormoscilla sp. GUM202]